MRFIIKKGAESNRTLEERKEMEMSTYVHLLSMMLLMFLVVWTGTAWFIALHSRFVWRIMRGEGDTADDGSAPGYRSLRLAALCYGAVGLILVILADVLE
jgi:hypothetical protein